MIVLLHAPIYAVDFYFLGEVWLSFARLLYLQQRPMSTSSAFFLTPSVVARSIFTDKGPITKPPTTLQAGTGVAFQGPDIVTLTGSSLTPSLVGRYLTLTGSANNNDGFFLIVGVLSPTKAKVLANFHVPEANLLTVGWVISDPRWGEIADSPSDVVVRVGGNPVVPDAVKGLTGQVVIPVAPGPLDSVEIDYYWIKKPTVEMRGLNNSAFTLNRGRPPRRALAGAHTYNYRAWLVNPKTYQAAAILNPGAPSLLAKLPQPLRRQLGYRAFERAYTAALNDPNLLLLNSPKHKIAYPLLQRKLSETFVDYEANTLPEDDLASPWERRGEGVAALNLGSLVVTDNTTGPFPGGKPLFWVHPVDLTFPHVFALGWRLTLDAAPVTEGVWTGVALGWANGSRAIVLGYLLDGGVKKAGILLRGGGIDPTVPGSWLTLPVDWSVLHSYRLFRTSSGMIRFFVDGAVIPGLEISESSLPFLAELNDPFTSLEGVFFGALSRPAACTASWDFLKYLALPTNPLQTAPSVFVSYEANTVPEDAPNPPWTLVGYHGTGTITPNDRLLLDSTSAVTAALEPSVGLVGGDFRAYARIEPLFSASAEFVLDVGVQGLTSTHGFHRDAFFAALSDGEKLVQLSFLTDSPVHKISYPGRSFPEEATPDPWFGQGTATATMVGQTLVIDDTSSVDGKVYAIFDPQPPGAVTRVFDPNVDAYVEARLRVVSFTPEPVTGFAGATLDVFDGNPLSPGRTYGLALVQDPGDSQFYVAFHAQGVLVSSFPFAWNDGKPHTYRVAKSFSGDLLTLFVDGTFLGSVAYSAFPALLGDAVLSFGSATAASMQAQSKVDWIYVNAWRAPLPGTRRYVGFVRGLDSDSLLGYHLPLKAGGVPGVTLEGNLLTDPSADFLAAGVAVGDPLLIDYGPLKGVYHVTAVLSNITLTVDTVAALSQVPYRIPRETDWTVMRKYRVFRDPTGKLSLLFDSSQQPLVQVRYPEDFPMVQGTAVDTVLNNLPGVVFGAMDPENLSQTLWDFVRYGVTRSPTELRIVPHHMNLNQRNVIASPEHLFTNLPHSHTQFSSASTGIPPVATPDFLASPTLQAFTQLFEGTPLVPSTQSKNVRGSEVVEEFVSGLNRPEDVLNSDKDFVLNDAARRVRVKVAEDVLYNDLKVIERTDGELDLLSPACDDLTALSNITYTKEVCLVYDGTTLPENAPNQPTPWILESDNPSEVTTTAFSGVLTYSTLGVGTKTIYKNYTPLPDAPSLGTEIKFTLKVNNDTSSGTGDTQIRFGVSAPGLTAIFALLTTPLGERLVILKDLNTGNVLSSLPLDFLDGNFHTYRVVRDPGGSKVSLYVDSLVRNHGWLRSR